MKNVMRKGSVAIVPILLAIMLLFWFIWFLGGESDQLHRINEVENLQHLQEHLLSASMKRYVDARTEYFKNNLNATEAELDAAGTKAADTYIHLMMQTNKIDD